MNTPKHTIIVPAYNTGDAIHKCIKSVMHQTFQDFELIIVDDGSKDQTPLIIDEYAASDCRVKAIHIPNGGVSHARNVGLDTAKGDYVMFIDSDDWIESDYLEQIEKRIYDNSDIYIVGITQDFQLSNGSLSHSKVQVSPIYKKIDSDAVAKEFGYLNLTVNMASACLKTYRRSFIQKHNIRFDKQMIVLEDYCFVLRCLAHKPQITSIPYVGYHYQLPLQLNILERRGNKEFYPSITLVLDALEEMNQALNLKGHSYNVFLRNAQEMMDYVLRQSRTAKLFEKSNYFSLVGNDPFFIKHCDEMAINGGGRFRLQCKLLKLHLYNLAYFAYRYL